MSGPEVRQILKIRTVRKPAVFLPGRQAINTFKNKKKKNFNFFQDFFFLVYFQIHPNLELLTPNLCPGTLS